MLVLQLVGKSPRKYILSEQDDLSNVVCFFFHGDLPFLVEKIFWVQAGTRTSIIQEQPVVWFRGLDVDIQHSLLPKAKPGTGTCVSPSQRSALTAMARLSLCLIFSHL